MGTSDPYCICSISGKPKLKKIQTKTLDNTVTPVWNHSEVLSGYQDLHCSERKRHVKQRKLSSVVLDFRYFLMFGDSTGKIACSE
eukprot:3968321-Amphidinium_carterae.1